MNLEKITKEDIRVQANTMLKTLDALNEHEVKTYYIHKYDVTLVEYNECVDLAMKSALNDGGTFDMVYFEKFMNSKKGR